MPSSRSGWLRGGFARGGTAAAPQYIGGNVSADRGQMMQARTSWLVLGAAVIAAVAAALWSWQRGSAPLPPPPAPVAAVTPPAPSASAPAAPYALPPQAALAPLGAGEIAGAVRELLGPGAALVLTDDLPHRLAATVDNLGREHAPAALWPIPPTAGRFTVEAAGDGMAIAGANSGRYAPLVRLVEGVDAASAARLYWRMYPLLQAAYRELGFPNGSFNDRLVRVIDLLLATPQPAQPVAVTLLQVKGPVVSTRPWVRYEFADPDLQSLAAGQKILVRVGPDNERRLKAKLRELRTALTTPSQ